MKRYKTEGNPFDPLGKDAKEYLGARAGDYYGMFTQGVARGRMVPLSNARNGMGQGRVLGAEAAKREGMVDGVMTLNALLQKMQRSALIQKMQGSAGRPLQGAPSSARQRQIELLAMG
ncbi:MAG: S49 family peptidase [Methylococcaceae bacterium]|nr:S49 family peptidase [Methylococcaceae bacterium]